MTALNKIIAGIPELREEASGVMTDRRYLRKLSELTGGALQKNCDVMQLPNGDVVVAEVKTMFYTYNWDAEKGKFVRSKSVRKRREDAADEGDDSEDNAVFAEESAALRRQRPSKPAAAGRAAAGFGAYARVEETV